MMSNSSDHRLDQLAMYREMQGAVPGLDAIYRLAQALISRHAKEAPHVLVVGAGGGREIEAFRHGESVGRITAVDPSLRNLDMARAVAGISGTSAEVSFIVGTVDDVPDGETFDIVTSLLVMHHLLDDGTKLAYLKGLRNRLAPNGRLIHADVCFDEIGDFDRLVPIYLAHADIAGASADATRLELDAIPQLPVVSAGRTCALFAAAGLTEPFEVFRSLWYRCCTSSRAPQ